MKLITLFLISTFTGLSLFFYQQKPLKQSLIDGKEIYTDFCMQCHMTNGEGVPGAFPPLANSDYLEDVDKIKFIDRMTNSHQVIGEEIPIQQSTAITELRSLKSSPEAILCNVATQSSGKSYTEHSKRVDVGLILFPEAQEVKETNNQWSVGIDFGTTNSCAYFKENKENSFQ